MLSCRPEPSRQGAILRGNATPSFYAYCQPIADYAAAAMMHADSKMHARWMRSSHSYAHAAEDAASHDTAKSRIRS